MINNMPTPLKLIIDKAFDNQIHDCIYSSNCKWASDITCMYNHLITCHHVTKTVIKQDNILVMNIINKNHECSRRISGTIICYDYIKLLLHIKIKRVNDKYTLLVRIINITRNIDSIDCEISNKEHKIKLNIIQLSKNMSKSWSVLNNNYKIENNSHLEIYIKYTNPNLEYISPKIDIDEFVFGSPANTQEINSNVINELSTPVKDAFSDAFPDVD
jgi:hypothetical protein